MGMALDEPRDTDKSFDINGLNVVVSPEDESYILGGAGVRVARTHSPFGSGFYVTKLGQGSSTCC